MCFVELLPGRYLRTTFLNPVYVFIWILATDILLYRLSLSLSSNVNFFCINSFGFCICKKNFFGDFVFQIRTTNALVTSKSTQNRDDFIIIIRLQTQRGWPVAADPQSEAHMPELSSQILYGQAKAGGRDAQLPRRSLTASPTSPATPPFPPKTERIVAAYAVSSKKRAFYSHPT